MIIKIYSTTTCPYCKMEREYFDAREIKYEEISIDHDEKAAQELMQLEGQVGVPFTVFIKDDGIKETLLGFDKKEIDRILSIS